MPVETGAIASCLMCGSSFVITLSVTGNEDPAKRHGLKWKKTGLEAKYEAIQEVLEHRMFNMQRCPECIELCTGLRYTEWLQSDPPIPCMLSPCRWLIFEAGEAPPLYTNVAEDAPSLMLGFDGKTPKWSLVQGVGPKGLQLDRSRSGRIFSRSLPPVLNPVRLLPGSSDTIETITLESFDPKTETSDSTLSFEMMINTVTEAMANQNKLYLNEDEQAEALLPWFVKLCSLTPLFRNWSRVESEKLLDPIIPTEDFEKLKMDSTESPTTCSPLAPASPLGVT